MRGAAIGRMRERVEIQEPVPTTDAGGGSSTAWTALAGTSEVWARVEPLRGMERMAAMQVDARATHRVTIRHHPDIKASHRLLWGSRLLYPVEPWLNQDERRRYLKATCREDTD